MVLGLVYCLEAEILARTVKIAEEGGERRVKGGHAGARGPAPARGHTIQRNLHLFPV